MKETSLIYHNNVRLYRLETNPTCVEQTIPEAYRSVWVKVVKFKRGLEGGVLAKKGIGGWSTCQNGEWSACQKGDRRLKSLPGSRIMNGR